MIIVLIITLIQGLMGAFDTLYHHELTERLPWRGTAKRELRLHGVRNALYVIVFLSFGFVTWGGLLAYIFAAILIIEVIITLMDFVEEDNSRKLPATERITHTILAVNYGVLLAFFAPVLIEWAQLETDFHSHYYGLLSWGMAIYAGGLILWTIRDLTASRRQFKEAPAMVKLSKPSQHILVTGGTGFVGKPLCRALIDDGHKVTILTRNPKAAFETMHLPITAIDKLPIENDYDAIINLAGETINQRWTATAKQKILTSRIQTTQDIIKMLDGSEKQPDVVISASAIGYYGASDTETFTEDSKPADHPAGVFCRDVCKAREAATQPIADMGICNINLRIGIVLEKDGGALAQMLFPFEFGLGGKVGSGQQWMSWIHRADLINLIEHIINSKLDGAVNAVAPNPVQQSEFASTLGKALGRPTVLPMPAFMVKTLFGQMGNDLLLHGQKVLPQKALDDGFVFKYETLDHALGTIV